jgi:hypothetical protein
MVCDKHEMKGWVPVLSEISDLQGISASVIPPGRLYRAFSSVMVCDKHEMKGRVPALSEISVLQGIRASMIPPARSQATARQKMPKQTQ